MAVVTEYSKRIAKVTINIHKSNRMIMAMAKRKRTNTVVGITLTAELQIEKGQTQWSI
jgi:hypothetical protein